MDPADGRVYLYAMSFLDEAQRIFACFDQPAARTLLARDDLDPTVRRAVVDCDDELGRALSARAA